MSAGCVRDACVRGQRDVCLVVLRLLDSVELAVNVVVLNVGRREGQADAAGNGEGRIDLEAQHLLIACPKRSTKVLQRVSANYTCSRS
jgi:hypothetical protein